MIHLGSAWYPEHWPEDRWGRDLELMLEAGFTVTRVAEFAWSRIEPREGEYDLGWLRRAVDMAIAAGLKVVIGTPTAAPPAWLTQRYPETLAINEQGTQMQHGARCHFDAGNPRYLKFCRKVARALAKEFGQDANVIGWQICNEYNMVSYSDGAADAFRTWLKRKYVTLEALNAAWTTTYWSQEYSDWSQIPLPMPRVGYDGETHNPALRLKWKQFATETYRHYQANQCAAIRVHARPEQWITHNFMGFFDGFDHYEMVKDLDFASWDQYVPRDNLSFGRDCVMHDLIRGLKHKRFWLMETQPGHVNWTNLNTALDKGGVRALAWNAIAHGADAILYWQWRNALNGQETMHGSLLAPDGEPRPIFHEIAQLGSELQRMSGALDAHGPQPAVALLHSYDDRWAINLQRHTAAYDPAEQLRQLYAPLAARNVDADVISNRASLAGYKVVIATPHIIDDEIAKSLTAFVRGGGTLVLGPRSGMKTPDNALHTERQPALLHDIAGARVDEYYALRAPIDVYPANGAPVMQAHTWAEWLLPNTGTQVLARYGKSNGWLDGQAAITSVAHAGGGRVICVGTWLQADAWESFLVDVLATADVLPVLPNLPRGLHARRRGDCIVVVNGDSPRAFNLPSRMVNVLAAEHVDALSLPAWGIAVLRPM